MKFLGGAKEPPSPSASEGQEGNACPLVALAEWGISRQNLKI